MSEPLLQVSDLCITFPSDSGGLQVTDRVSLSIARGEVVALAGESGSGKSVTALSLTGLLPAGTSISGRIRFDGQELSKASDRELAGLRGGRIAYVFQDPATALNPVFTAGYQIRESLHLHGYQGDPAARTRELLQAVGIREPDRVQGAYPHQLSGGQQQRVMIAMALAGDPDLLVADEPTTALDVTVQAQILELLASIQAQRRMAVLLITHNLAIAAKLAQRLVVMYAGQVVEEGPVAKVLSSPGHPYTRALIRAIPRLRHPEQALTGIPGQIPMPSDLPSGCRFHPRCTLAQARCRAEEPPVADCGNGRKSRCWFWRELLP